MCAFSAVTTSKRYFTSLSVPAVQVSVEMLETAEVPKHALPNFLVKFSKHHPFVLC